MEDQRKHFELVLWPHLRGAYNLAHWLVGNRQDAEDVVQESFTKAFQSTNQFRGGDVRAWLMKIVRNTSLTLLQRRPCREVGWTEHMPEPADTAPCAETQLIHEARRQQIRAAIERLPREFREAIVLRELEGMSYKEIAWVLQVPIGTVMSRLSRARTLLTEELAPSQGELR